MQKLYRQYDEKWLLHSPSYGAHESGMVDEALHSKSDIAAELAWRDDEIARLRAAMPLSQLISWDRTSDHSVKLVFSSARAATQFEQLIMAERADL